MRHLFIDHRNWSLVATIKMKILCVYFYMKCIRCPIYVQVPKRSLPVLCDECYKYLKNPLMNTDPKEIWTTYYVPRYIEN